MNKALVFIMCLLSLHATSQNFQEYRTVQLPDSVDDASAHWLDIDNSGLYDIVLLTTATSGKQYMQFIPGDTLNPSVLSNSFVRLAPYDAFAVHDYNHDNQLDFIFSTHEAGVRKTILLQNNGNFGFTQSDLSLPAFSLMRFFDLDSDAVPECIVSGEDETGTYFTKTYARSGTTWVVTADTLQAKLSAFETVDLNKDGLADIFLSGAMKPDSVFSMALSYNGNGFVAEARTRALTGSQLSDINLDGTLDVIASGKNDGTPVYMTMPDALTITNRNATDLQNVFWADLNADGTSDEAKLLITVSDTVNTISYTNSSIEVLNHRYLRQQRFGDLDHDGDLDLLQVAGKDRLTIKLYENLLDNQAPSKPLAVAIPLYDHVFLYWSPATDDHTPSASLTYDVFLEGGTARQDAGFDLLNARRLVVDHGNNGTANFRLLKGVEATTFNYAIQAVDNALHGGGLCTGGGTNCVDATTTAIELCSGENVAFSAGAEALWFSLANGYLGKSAQLMYTAESRDTVFSFIPSETGCAKAGLFEIQIKNTVKNLPAETRYICPGSGVTLNAPANFTTGTWTSAKKGAAGSGTSINFQTQVDDVVTVSASNTSGCTISKAFNLVVSIPKITVTPPAAAILHGQTVTLTASGAATYSWAPATGLSDPRVASPVASPAQDTQYVVTGYDSIGCTSTATAVVTVEATGFIATLFSPNADGKNDRLRIYGVQGADQFSFEIYNREGKRVYRTEQLGEALGLGWDGTTNGADQPNGTYFWRITGSSNGRRILLNGKVEGSVVLLR